MTNNPPSPILHHWYFDASGALLSAKEGEARHEREWIHLSAIADSAEAWLEQYYPELEPWAVEALLAEETRPRFTVMGQGALLILRGVNLNENADPEDMISIRLWIDQTHIISVQRRPLKAVRDTIQQLEQGEKIESSASIAAMLMANLLTRMAPVLTELDERVDRIEEQLIQQAQQQQNYGEILSLRRQSIALKRYLAPQKDALLQLVRCQMPWISEDDRLWLQESSDRLTRYLEDMAALRERTQLVQDEISATLANKLNQNMYVLSVIAAIFLPLGFLTGLLGINVGGMPGAENEWAFWMFSALLAVLVAVQIMVFRKLKWI